MRRTLAVSLFALVCSTGVYAQAVVGSGAITGIVLDKYGDGIPETTINLTNKTLGVKRTMLTSDDGVFTLPALLPGRVRPESDPPGYADWELPSFDLAVGETLNFRITCMPTGRPTDRRGAALSGARAGQQDQRHRHRYRRAAFRAAHAGPTGRPAGIAGAGRGGKPPGRAGFPRRTGPQRVSSGQPQHHRQLFPLPPQRGAVHHAGIGERDAGDPGGADARFHHTMGGWVNAVSKSGTNNLHASAYDYYAQNSWDKPDFFGNGFVPTGRYNNGGVSVARRSPPTLSSFSATSST
jgi:hypothetical protein